MVKITIDYEKCEGADCAKPGDRLPANADADREG